MLSKLLNIKIPKKLYEEPSKISSNNYAQKIIQNSQSTSCEK
jgi:hypothetical protein